MLSKCALVQTFLTDSAGQLTAQGIAELKDHMRESQLAVFFRNNHFAVLTKENGVIKAGYRILVILSNQFFLVQLLYLLVNDIGFERHNQIIWQSLHSTDGDCTFVDEYFQLPPEVPPLPVSASDANDERTREQQEEHE